MLCLSCSWKAWILQYVYVFITSGFESEWAGGGCVLAGDLARTWKDEEMKAKEDERWFKEEKISWGSSFHLSGSIKECARSCLFGVNWPLLSGAPQSDASNHCQVDSLSSIPSDSNVSQMLGRWEYGSGGRMELQRKEMLTQREKSKEKLELWYRQKKIPPWVELCLLRNTEEQTMSKKWVFSRITQSETFSLSEELSRMRHVSAGSDCQSFPSFPRANHHTAFLRSHPKDPRLHIWRMCICYTFRYPFIKGFCKHPLPRVALLPP